MISIFRKNVVINSLLLLPYIVLLRLKSLFDPAPAAILPDNAGFLNKLVYNTFSTSLAQSILCIVILYINALLINRIVIKNHLSKENTMISGLMYALFCSILLNFIQLSPEFLSATFVILSLQCIFSSYNNLSSSDEIFLAGFYMSIASLFYFPVIYLFFFCYLGFVIMRSFPFIEKIQHIAGWLVPYFLLLSWQYFSNVPIDIATYFFGKSGISHLTFGLNVFNFIVLIFVLLLVLLFLFSYSLYNSKRVIASQKRISILYWLMLFIGLTISFYLGTNLNHLLLFAIPASIFFTFNLLEIRNRILPELIHLFLILILVIIHLDLIKIN